MRSTTSDQAVQLAQANRVLVDQGVLDAFGHVSVRVADDPNRFLLARNMAPAQVEPNDVQVFDLAGWTADDRVPYLERFIHGEIYRARPDVMAVVHSHSPAVIPFSVASLAMRPVFHMAGFLAEGINRFEIRDVRGDATDLLIRDRALGVELARSLADAPIVLMRGHGSVTVADSLPLAVYRAVYAEKNAALQLAALQLGEVAYLSNEEGRAAAETNAGQLERAWNNWVRESSSPQK